MLLGRSFLDFIGLPDWYPQFGELELDIDDALLDAAESVVREWRDRDPLVDAALDGRWDPWTWLPHPVGDLPVGTRVRLRDWDGELTPPTARDREWHPGRVPVAWRGGSDYPPEPHRKPEELLTARLPVPLDLAGALAVLGRERGGSPPSR